MKGMLSWVAAAVLLDAGLVSAEAQGTKRVYAVSGPGQKEAALEAGSDPLTGELQKRAEAAVRAIE